MDSGSLALLKELVSVKDAAPTLRAIAMTVITIITSFRMFSQVQFGSHIAFNFTWLKSCRNEFAPDRCAV